MNDLVSLPSAVIKPTKGRVIFYPMDNFDISFCRVYVLSSLCRVMIARKEVRLCLSLCISLRHAM